MLRQTLIGLAIFSMPTLISAHSSSEATTPADGSIIVEVSEFLIRFNDPMRVVFASLTSNTGDVPIGRDTTMEFTTEFRARPLAELSPGSYRFDWRGMASDGHPMQGSFSFTVVK